MVKKKGQETSTGVIVGIVVLVLAIIIGLFFYYRADIFGLTNQQVCHTSVVTKATGKGVGGLNCKTDYVCISGGGECANMNPTETIKVDPSNKTQILNKISNQLADCWYTFGEGKLDWAGLSQGPRPGAQCAVCSVIGFDSSVQKALTSITSPENSRFASAAQWADNYNKYSSLFQKSAKDYLPKGMSQSYFESLLLAVAYQNNWGPSNDGNWMMGYHVNDVNYQTPEQQLAAVAPIFQKAFDKTGANGGYQTGDITGNYAKCTQSNLKDQETCILSVYHTGETAYGGGLFGWHPSILGWTPLGKENTKGQDYASAVIINSNVISNYLSKPIESSGQAQAQTSPLTYKDLFNYLAANKVTKDNQVQTYLSFLYGVPTIGDLLSTYTTQNTYKDLYNSKSIPLNAQYSIITGEGKGAFWGTFGTNYLKPIMLNTNEVSNYLGSYCTNYVTYS